MKKYIFLFFAVCAFSVYANAQNRTETALPIPVTTGV